MNKSHEKLIISIDRQSFEMGRKQIEQFSRFFLRFPVVFRNSVTCGSDTNRLLCMNYNINLMVGLSWFIEYNMAQPSKQKGEKKTLHNIKEFFFAIILW
jgi:hypothetical protein